MVSKEILLIDKPKGISSYDCIRKLKSNLGNVKMGHAGTLDPLASGLLIIGIGNGTKKLSEYLRLPKTYEVKILFGIKTETGDLEGKVVEEQRAPISKENLLTVLKEMRGGIELKVPLYSAVKVSGMPLYKYARGKNKNIPDPPKKEMKVNDIRFKTLVKQGDSYVASLEIDVESGAYIRSIVEEIGARLGVPATTKELRRIKIGDFNIQDAIRL